jgi:hypothetical protein
MHFPRIAYFYKKIVHVKILQDMLARLTRITSLKISVGNLASAEALGKPGCAFVDPALVFDELIERFGMILVLQGVPQNS